MYDSNCVHRHSAIQEWIMGQLFYKRVWVMSGVWGWLLVLFFT